LEGIDRIVAEDIVSNVNVPVFPVPGVTATIFTVAVLRRSPYILEGIINKPGVY
jgi:hypothetical protein